MDMDMDMDMDMVRCPPGRRVSSGCKTQLHVTSVGHSAVLEGACWRRRDLCL